MRRVSHCMHSSLHSSWPGRGVIEMHVNFLIAQDPANTSRALATAVKSGRAVGEALKRCDRGNAWAIIAHRISPTRRERLLRWSSRTRSRCGVGKVMQEQSVGYLNATNFANTL